MFLPERVNQLDCACESVDNYKNLPIRAAPVLWSRTIWSYDCLLRKWRFWFRSGRNGHSQVIAQRWSGVYVNLHLFDSSEVGQRIRLLPEWQTCM